MVLPDRVLRLRAVLLKPTLIAMCFLGVALWRIGLMLEAYAFRRDASQHPSWFLDHPDQVVFVGAAATLTSLAIVAALVLASRIKSWLATRVPLSESPLGPRLELWSEPQALPKHDSRRSALLLYLLILGGSVFLIARHGVAATIFEPTFVTTSAAAAILLLFPAVGLLARTQRWSERQFLAMEHRLRLKHAKEIDRRLAADEKIHEYRLAFRAELAGGGARRPLLAVITDRRLLVMRPILLGLNLVQDASVHIGKIGAARAEAPGVLRGVLAPGFGQTGLLSIDRLGARNLHIRLISMDATRAMAEAIAQLKSSEKAGAGALAVADLDGPDNMGALGFPLQDEEGQLSLAKAKQNESPATES